MIFNKKTKAFLSVEASLIMPVVLFTVIVLIYLGFYLYDVNAVNVFALNSMYSEKDEDSIKQAFLENLSKKLINTRITNCVVEYVEDEILVQFEGEFKFPFKSVDIRINKKIKNVMPVKFIKYVKMLGEVLDGGS